MMLFIAGLRHGFLGSRLQPAVSGRIEAAELRSGLLPLMADTQASGPAECEEREMEPDPRIELG